MDEHSVVGERTTSCLIKLGLRESYELSYDEANKKESSHRDDMYELAIHIIGLG